MIITDDMRPFTVNGEYCVPVVDNRMELGGYDTDAWPDWFKNFVHYQSEQAVDYGQVPIKVMNRELALCGARLVQFDTQDGWMLCCRSEQHYLMLVLKWS